MTERPAAPRENLYALSHAEASTLAGACSLPADLRMHVFEKYAQRHGVVALANLFAQFMGLANSVVANNRDALEIFAMVHCDFGPYQAEKLNLPTIFGACNGAMLADGVDQDGLCGGCAFRVGTCANQSPVTTCDADWCGHPGEASFFCHEELDERGAPTKACAGFARLRAKRKASPG